MQKKHNIIAVSLLLALSACGGGGGGAASPPPNTVSGDVMTPNGMIASIANPSLADRLLNWILPSAVADLVGIADVPDNTVVELVQLDTGGNVISVLSSTTTTNGRYSFNLDNLNLTNTSSLAVRLPNSGGAPIHAIVSGSNVDVVPEAEVIYQSIVTSGNPYSNYTQNEIRDLVEALRQASTFDGGAVGGDINSTVSALDTVLSNETGLSTFLTNTGNTAGQTSSGPGDIGNYFPQTQGAVYTFSIQETLDGTVVGNSVETLTVNETTVSQGVATTRVTSSIDGDLFFSESDSGITHAADFGGSVSMSTQIPVILTFPNTPGESFTVFQNSPVAFNDPDIGVINGNIDISYSVLDSRTLSVPAGTFTNVLGSRLTISGPFTAQGITINVTGTQDMFFAPGVGVIRIDTTVTASAAGVSTVATETATLTSVTGL